MGFVRPHALILVGMTLMTLALILDVVGLAAPGWCSLMLAGEKGEALIGLWEYCIDLPTFNCEDLDQLWDVQGWLEGSRAMGILAMIAMVTCLVSVLLICCLSHCPLFFAIAPWTALASGLLIFMEFGLFVGGMEMEKNSLGRDFHYQYAFVLTIIAFILSLFASLLFFIGEASNRKSLHR